MRFTKMHGAGNDYIYVNGFKETIGNPQKLARKVSDRHFGVGSDGLVVIGPSDTADFKMDMYNADGSVGEMCGNAIRCIAKYVYDRGMTTKTSISVETLAGVKYLEITLENGKTALVRVDMGAPILTAVDIPALFDAREVIGLPLLVNGREYPVTCVSMGNPHCVTFLEEDVRNLDLCRIGPAFENHEKFPKRINTEFANILDPEMIRMRVWERGSGETLACGTGACATAVAAMLNGRTKEEVTVRLTGGDLRVHWDRTKDTVYLTGPAEFVFDGDIPE